jgi:lipoyl-dependent peroxiredoxin subunit D
MEHIEKIREQLPDVARDIKINLDNVLVPGTLNASQVWGVALASAYAARNPVLVEAIAAQTRAAGIDAGVIDDAKAAAVLMGMNNVFYRFRHMIGKEDYAQRPARLRMQRLNQVASNKADFELFCLAVSAINDCEACVRAHENTVVDHGLSVDHVHDAVRIAATVHAAAVALEIGA